MYAVNDKSNEEENSQNMSSSSTLSSGFDLDNLEGEESE